MVKFINKSVYHIMVNIERFFLLNSINYLLLLKVNIH